MLNKIKDYVARYFEAKKAIYELSQFSDRDLADIGIKRYDIERIVTEHYTNENNSRKV